MRKAFTLVELLVVITIIVVLLALLMPALSKATYQAQLTKCSAQMRGVASGATQYAFDHKRAYMDRIIHRQKTFPYGLKGPAAFALANGQTVFDDRPIHKGYIPMKSLVDPLCEPVDLELDTDPATEAIYSSYVLYYGFGFEGETAMQRLGDRWTFRDTKAGLPGARFAFSWLLGDLDINQNGAHATASHPDRKRLLHPSFAQGGDFEYGNTQQEAAFGSIPVTYSFWRYVGPIRRGPMDLNFAAEDGGVVRLTDVDYIYDDRVAHIPNVGNHDGYSGRWQNIAKP